MIYLRKLNDSDLSFLNYVENDHENWKSSNTISKFENKELKLLINQSKIQTMNLGQSINNRQSAFFKQELLGLTK